MSSGSTNVCGKAQPHNTNNGYSSFCNHGLTPLDHPIKSGHHRRQRTKHQQEQNEDIYFTALNRWNPIYNFLIECYGLKGAEGCILLEGVSERNWGETFHLRGATVDSQHGVLYNPHEFYRQQQGDSDAAACTATLYLCNRSVLEQTIITEPILHCHGLHELAMQYHPEGAPPPPSTKYQSHLPLRVSCEVIYDPMERRGVHCTHVDTLRFFAQPVHTTCRCMASRSFRKDVPFTERKNLDETWHHIKLRILF